MSSARAAHATPQRAYLLTHSSKLDFARVFSSSSSVFALSTLRRLRVTSVLKPVPSKKTAAVSQLSGAGKSMTPQKMPRDLPSNTGVWNMVNMPGSAFRSSYVFGIAENAEYSVTFAASTDPPPKSTKLPAILVGLIICFSSPLSVKYCEGAPGVSVGGRDVSRRPRARYLDFRVERQDALLQRHVAPALWQRDAERAAIMSAFHLLCHGRGRVLRDGRTVRRRGSTRKHRKTVADGRRALGSTAGGGRRRLGSGGGSVGAWHQTAVAFVEGSVSKLGAISDLKDFFISASVSVYVTTK